MSQNTEGLWFNVRADVIESTPVRTVKRSIKTLLMTIYNGAYNIKYEKKLNITSDFSMPKLLLYNVCVILQLYKYVYMIDLCWSEVIKSHLRLLS